MDMMNKAVVWAWALLAAVSCGGGSPVVNAPADLTPYLQEDGLFHLKAGDVEFTLRGLPGGTFQMGQTFDQGMVRNPSIHAVILDGFAIGTGEVSQALWEEVMGKNPSSVKKPEAPVTRVDWKDAVQFTEKLSRKTGIPFRLATESEWEYAARQDASMAEGVREWCSDRWAEKFRDSLYINPQGPSVGEERVVRGGSFAQKGKASTRTGLASYVKAEDLGLRIAVSTGDPCPPEIMDVIVHNRPPREKIEKLVPETITVQGVSFKMLPVEGGTFQMGATEEQGKPAEANEFPVHTVTLDNFMIGQYEVTCELWEAVMGRSLPLVKGGKYPAGNVSWYDAQAFIRKLNELTGRKFRLPTEAEWEFAARGGNKSRHTAFAGSRFHEWVSVCDKEMNPKPVGSLDPNELGLYDMSGNVWEWCQDLFAAYPSEAQVNPTGPSYKENGRDFRVLRSGSAATVFWKTRVSKRSENLANHFKTTMGFRLAL